MNFRNRKTEPAVMMSIGMLCLASALAWPRFVPLTFHAGPDWIDGIRGVLFGMAIGLNLLSVMKTAKQRGL
jgi:hypothetical protein